MAVPKLRFKEFDGDWSNKKIGNIASKVGSGSTPRGGAEAYTDHGIIFIRSQNVNNDQLLLDDVAYIPEETHVKMSGSKVIANDILLNITGASIGRSCVVPHDFTEANVNQHVCIIRTPNDDPIFVQSFLSSENGQNAIQSKQAGGGREGLNFQAIRSIDFHFPPSKEEQTKIASFLSNVDEKISQLTQKHQLLSQYKQGMMQKLFSQQIRFKADDGSEFGEWGNKALNTLCSRSYQGINTVADKVEYQQSGYPILQAKHITSEKLDLVDVRYLSDLDYEKYKEKYIPNVNDILFSNIGTIGKVVLVDAENPFFIAWNIFLITPKETLITPLYLTSYLRWLTALNYFDNLQTGNATKFINKTDLLATVINLPCLAEQTKIANFLSAIDQKIEVVAQQIEQAKTWKKGLLQQMFI